VNHIHHGFLVDSHHSAIGHRGCGAHAAGLSYEAALPEEITLVQNAYCGFLPVSSHNDEFYFSLLHIENRIGRVALNKDTKIVRLSGKVAIVRPPSMVERKVWRSNLRCFLAAAPGVMVGSLSMLKHAQEPQCSVKQLCDSVGPKVNEGVRTVVSF
jgi:hypothetical protein